MEMRHEDKAMLRRVVRMRIDAQLRSQYQAVLQENVPEQFFALIDSAVAPAAAGVKHNS
jgi:hypothetical protein